MDQIVAYTYFYICDIKEDFIEANGNDIKEAIKNAVLSTNTEGSDDDYIFIAGTKSSDYTMGNTIMEIVIKANTSDEADKLSIIFREKVSTNLDCTILQFNKGSVEANDIVDYLMSIKEEQEKSKPKNTIIN